MDFNIFLKKILITYILAKSTYQRTMAAYSERTLRRNTKKTFDFIVSERKRRKENLDTELDEAWHYPEDNLNLEHLNSTYLEKDAEFDGKSFP